MTIFGQPTVSFLLLGLKDKAFLNATWKMSPQEIERANETTLVPGANDIFSFLFAPEVTNRKRFMEMDQKDASLWGHDAEINYLFFDNQLYEYNISLTAYDANNPYNEILATL